MNFEQFPPLKEYQTPDCDILRIESQHFICGSTFGAGFADPLSDDEDCTNDDDWI